MLKYINAITPDVPIMGTSRIEAAIELAFLTNKKFMEGCTVFFNSRGNNAHDTSEIGVQMDEFENLKHTLDNTEESQNYWVLIRDNKVDNKKTIQIAFQYQELRWISEPIDYKEKPEDIVSSHLAGMVAALECPTAKRQSGKEH